LGSGTLFSTIVGRVLLGGSDASTKVKKQGKPTRHSEDSKTNCSPNAVNQYEHGQDLKRKKQRPRVYLPQLRGTDLSTTYLREKSERAALPSPEKDRRAGAAGKDCRSGRGKNGRKRKASISRSDRHILGAKRSLRQRKMMRAAGLEAAESPRHRRPANREIPTFSSPSSHPETLKKRARKEPDKSAYNTSFLETRHGKRKKTAAAHRTCDTNHQKGPKRIRKSQNMSPHPGTISANTEVPQSELEEKLGKGQRHGESRQFPSQNDGKDRTKKRK